MHLDLLSPDLGAALASMIQSGCAIAVAVAAWKGLGRWREELAGKRTAELAEDALARFYEIADVIAAVRSPMIHAFEMLAIDPHYLEQDEGTKWNVEVEALVQRLSSRQAQFAELRALSYRVRAALPDAIVAFNKLDWIHRRMIAAIATAAGRGHARRHAGGNAYDNIRRVLENQGDGDEIATATNEMVALAETHLSSSIAGSASKPARSGVVSLFRRSPKS